MKGNKDKQKEGVSQMCFRPSNETYVANLIRQCFSPRDVNERLRRLNANGRAIYEVV